MASIYWDIKKRGGVAATHELLADGHTSHQLTAAVRRGEVLRLRQGHYGCPDLTAPEQQAVRVGGRLTGWSAARHYGIWSPANLKLEVTVRRNANGLRTPIDPTRRLPHAPLRQRTRVSWDGDTTQGTRSVVEPLGCLVDIALNCSEEDAFAAVESALYLGYVSVQRWTRAVEQLPHTRRRRLALAGNSSESGGESIAKLHFIDLGIAFAQQVGFRGVGRVDFQIGERLIIEIDGAEFHTDAASFENDRRRDALLAARGYRVLRFSYKQVTQRWPEVEAAIRGAMSRGDHLG